MSITPYLLYMGSGCYKLPLLNYWFSRLGHVVQCSSTLWAYARSLNLRLDNGSDTICYDLGKSTSHICAITQKGLIYL
jgi:hypothetical protein